MAEAVISIGTRYEDLDAYPDFATDFPDLPVPTLVVAPHAETHSFSYEAQSVDSALVEDDTAADEEIALDFGDVAEALAFVVKNNSRQDLSVAINGVLGGTANADVVSAASAIDSVLTAQLAILNAFDGGDDAADIVAAIATANAAIAAAQSDLSDAMDEDGTAIFTLPHGGVLACALPPDAATPVEAISLYTTDTQDGDGTVEFKVFGSVAP